jgi:hypothetical protein
LICLIILAETSWEELLLMKIGGHSFRDWREWSKELRGREGGFARRGRRMVRSWCPEPLFSNLPKQSISRKTLSGWKYSQIKVQMRKTKVGLKVKSWRYSKCIKRLLRKRGSSPKPLIPDNCYNQHRVREL